VRFLPDLASLAAVSVGGQRRGGETRAERYGGELARMQHPRCRAGKERYNAIWSGRSETERNTGETGLRKHKPVQGVAGGIGQKMVRAVGIEPTLLAEPDFESGASTNSTTPAGTIRLQAFHAIDRPRWSSGE
jgi:hypothetical protein